MLFEPKSPTDLMASTYINCAIMQFTLFLPLSIGASVTQLTQIHAEDPKQDP